jgi:hypothetical protein
MLIGSMLTRAHNEGLRHGTSRALHQFRSQLLSDWVTEKHGVTIREVINLLNHSLSNALVGVAYTCHACATC